MARQRWLRAAIRDLRKRKQALQRELDLIENALVYLQRTLERDAGARGTRLTPKGREAISRAAKKRWAEYRKESRR